MVIHYHCLRLSHLLRRFVFVVLLRVINSLSLVISLNSLILVLILLLIYPVIVIRLSLVLVLVLIEACILVRGWHFLDGS